jgi:hypothetical protein
MHPPENPPKSPESTHLKCLNPLIILRISAPKGFKGVKDFVLLKPARNFEEQPNPPKSGYLSLIKKVSLSKT